MRQRAGDQIGVDLLDDGVAAVLGFGLHEGERAVGEHRVIAVGRQEFFLAGDLGRVVAVDPAHDQSGGHLMPGAGERRVCGFGDLGVGDPPAGVFVVDGLRVLDVEPLAVGDAVARGADLRVDPGGDREPYITAPAGGSARTTICPDAPQERAVVIASEIWLAAPRAEPALPARSRVAAITGAHSGVDSVVISGL